MRAKVYISPKAGILDPQGLAVRNALQNLGFKGVNEVRVGKYIELELEDCENPDKQLQDMCQELLYNPLVESCRYEIMEA